MPGTLTGPFAIDRIEVPTFYVVTQPGALHQGVVPDIHVFAESASHFSQNWITLGFVSKQTPLGQGTYAGFPRSDVIEAQPAQVLAWHRIDHPYGLDFRPACIEAVNASFHRDMAGGVRNWTNDDLRPGELPIVDISSGEIASAGTLARDHYADLMARWDQITGAQRDAVFKSLFPQI